MLRPIRIQVKNTKFMSSFRFGRSHWKDFTSDDLNVIEKERKSQHEKNETRDTTKTYGIVCRACTKPNTLTVNFCTGCGFTATEDDVQALPENVFMDIIIGKDTTKPLWRDENYLIFNDKFGVSPDHVDVIPSKVILDITSLTRDDIPMLERLYEIGLDEFKSRNLERFAGKDLRDYITAGYNFPVSVKHLHLHMVLPPFKHKKVFGWPRWHSHQKIVSELKQYGHVKTYDATPNEQEWKEEYDRAMKNDDELQK
jgi:diadenosine tetraphosphate (Ap4A) HIT family hydrolase